MNHKGWPGQTGSDRMDWHQSRGVKDAQRHLQDGTVTYTVAASYMAISSVRAAAAAEAAAQRKEIKYAELAQTHLFYQLALDLNSSAIWVIESLESLMTHERLHFCFNVFQ